MRMILSSNKIFVFDLDDTLYPEVEFEASGIRYVHSKLEIKNISIEKLLLNRKRWVEIILNEAQYKISKNEILSLYRNHIPNISLYADAKRFLEKVFVATDLCLITDGRSSTQRAKLRSLGVDFYFKKIIISEEVKSEKPAKENFYAVIDQVNDREYVYFADNPKKDFVTPNQLGWLTVCLLDRGHNIHKQDFSLSKDFLPQKIINSFDEILIVDV